MREQVQTAAGGAQMQRQIAPAGVGRQARQRGVTLLELMISLGMAAAVAASVYSVLLNQNRTYNIREGQARLQQNLRMAADLITRNINLAGYGTKGYAVTSVSLGVAGAMLALRGYNATGASDSFQVVYADPSKLAMTIYNTNQPCTSSSLKFNNPTDASFFKDAAYMVCFDYSNAQAIKSFMLKVTSIDSNSGVVGIVSPTDNSEFYGSAGECPSTQNYPLDLQCGAANILTFYVDKNNTDGIGPGSATHPTLMMSTSVSAFSHVTGASAQSSDVAIADNIEDLQLEVCNVTLSESCDAAGWGTFDPSYNTAAAVVKLRQVRVNLWARSDRPDALGSKHAIVANPLTGLTDGYYRERLQATALLRNIRLLQFYN